MINFQIVIRVFKTWWIKYKLLLLPLITLLLIPFSVRRDSMTIAGFGAAIIENYTKVIWGTTITGYPPPPGPYYGPWVLNYPIIIIQFILVIIFVIYWRKNK